MGLAKRGGEIEKYKEITFGVRCLKQLRKILMMGVAGKEVNHSELIISHMISV